MTTSHEIDDLEAAYKQAYRAYIEAARKLSPEADRLIAEIRAMLTRLEKLLKEYRDGQVD